MWGEPYSEWFVERSTDRVSGVLESILSSRFAPKTPIPSNACVESCSAAFQIGRSIGPN